MEPVWEERQNAIRRPVWTANFCWSMMNLSVGGYRADTMVVGHIAGEHAEAIFKFMSTRHTPVLQDDISLELSWLNPVYCYRHTKRVSGRNATDNTPTCMKCHWLLCLGVWVLGEHFFVLGFRALAFCRWCFVPRSTKTWAYYIQCAPGL